MSLLRDRLSWYFSLNLTLVSATGPMPSPISPDWHDKASGFFSNSGIIYFCCTSYLLSFLCFYI